VAEAPVSVVDSETGCPVMVARKWRTTPARDSRRALRARCVFPLRGHRPAPPFSRWGPSRSPRTPHCQVGNKIRHVEPLQPGACVPRMAGQRARSRDRGSCRTASSARELVRALTRLPRRCPLPA
jgi:hypothetical protein